MVLSIQNSTGSAVTSMSAGIETVEEGGRLASDAGSALVR